VSANIAGTDASNGASFSPVFSADGTKVAFVSSATNLGPTDTNGTLDVYLRDLSTGTTSLVSADSSGTDAGNSASLSPVISADGTKVAFRSGASNLGPTDTNGTTDVYLRDLGTGITSLVSVNAAGTDAGNGHSDSPVISADGTKVAFISNGSDLGPTDTNGADDIYVHDLEAGITSLVSVNAAGTDAGNKTGNNGPASHTVISADGTKVAFASAASNLGPADTNGTFDAYLRDLETGTTSLVSVNAAGTDAGDSNSYGAVFSADGTKVAFRSLASNLGPADTNGTWDVYVRDLGEAAIAVQIDIKPGTFPNDVKPGSKGKMPVAILSTPSFDASTVNSGTVHFGATGTEAAPGKTSLKDVDADGDIDMILQFDIKDTGIACGDTSASLTGETLSGSAVEGSDSVATVGCR
jgi:Tol biopolymer transport system component